jgi:hypothetical protein
VAGPTEAKKGGAWAYWPAHRPGVRTTYIRATVRVSNPNCTIVAVALQPPHRSQSPPNNRHCHIGVVCRLGGGGPIAAQGYCA